MLIVMEHHATQAQIDAVAARIRELGYEPLPIPGANRVAIGVLGNRGYVDEEPFRDLAGIQELIHVTKPYKLASRDFHPEDTVVRIGTVEVAWHRPPVIIAGPCAVESREQTLAAARAVKAAGGRVLRGGAFKPRTSPHSFQGLGEEGLEILAEARAETGLAVVTEVMRIDQIERVAEVADCLQVGARNMQNFDLLRALGEAGRPVLLKRGLSATLEEWLAAAEYIVASGNDQVILCERGIRTFERALRNTLDLGVVPWLRQVTHLPVIVDPSHALGRRDLVPPLARAAWAVGACGIMVEVHPDPARALSDGPQSMDPEGFAALCAELDRLGALLDAAAP
ncbi:3-deoxy-7-phosphoheptulonate synthase [Inmirania thermothiophila]|uniref:3-deoxy-D-arabinoheptulosonate-7-phosphate synthase n=1 Tax=Inmirania thermothiophila TaxID=1750597 RepID=A0A3N1Y1P7_9GAMM|nr:3-deoxy-7-phosphoheptulonate synthase [Inmirania thermothiophila]ROR32739.1 3-deoxy-D-arabinoheptulosonate-7-phosphate synthase [Inmirania thermothiophila]